jgi:hypothetical protein
MVVAMGENEAFHAAGTGRQCVTDQCRRQVLQGAVAFLQPATIDRIKPWVFKCARRAQQAFIGLLDPKVWCRLELVEIPPELLDRTRMQGTLEFVVNDALESGVGVCDRSGKNQSERPGGEYSKERRMTTKKGSEVVSRRRDHKVEEHGSTVCADADRKPVWKGAVGLRVGARGETRHLVDRH